MVQTTHVLTEFARILKAKVTYYANYGILIGFLSIISATLMVVYLKDGMITLESIAESHRVNFALWFLDAMPILFALWGQYVGSMLAFEASAMVVDETHHLRTQTEALEVEVQHTATYDKLTDLPNRVLFSDRLEQAIGQAHRNKQRLAVLVLDLDDFKEINNTLGHFSGDLLLKQLATRLHHSVRDTDTVARLSGDEFAVLVQDIDDPEDAIAIADKICKAVEPPFMLGGLSVDMLVSVGIALYPDNGDDVDTLMQKADVAMFMAKQKTGFAIELYTVEHDKHSPQRLTLMGELRDAIENGGLILEYQPKVDINKRSIIAVESLVRWQHPRYGRMPPDEFITLAERTGLIRPLTYWVMNEALRQCAAWEQRGFPIDVAVNVSAPVLLDSELPERVASALLEHDLAPQRLIVEITESSLMEDQEYALHVVSQLSKLGARISIDDFGTGYSSLAYLRRLPVNEIKIDKSFVMGMSSSDNDVAIVRATIGLAQNLGMTVIAEGVADEGAWRRVVRMGCDLAQGYYISPPTDSNTILHLLSTSEWSMH